MSVLGRGVAEGGCGLRGVHTGARPGAGSRRVPGSERWTRFRKDGCCWSAPMKLVFAVFCTHVLYDSVLLLSKTIYTK